jgi:two-component system chemotaxis response regulator CheB
VLLKGLPRDLPAAVVVCQHRLHGPSELAALLAQHTMWPVCEVDDKETVGAGRVFLAPPGYHLMVDGPQFALSTEAPVQYSRPSVDVLFDSLAHAFGPRVVGVILTGANDDGAQGLRQIVRYGGAAVVQDPETAERRAMPDAAILAVPAATVVPLSDVPVVVSRLVIERAARRSGASR